MNEADDPTWDPNLHGGRGQKHVESHEETATLFGKLTIAVAGGGLVVWGFYAFLCGVHFLPVTWCR